MPTEILPTDPIPLVHLARTVLPDQEKLLLTSLDLGLQTMEPYLSPAARAAVVGQFGAYLGKPSHPVLVSNEFVDCVCRLGFPTLALSDARRKLARLSVASYRQSILGRVMFASVRIMGLERVLRQTPRQFAATTNYGTRWVASLGPRHWRFDCEDELLYPETMIGNLEEVAQIVGVPTLTVTFSLRAPRHYSYDITWDSP